MLEYKWKLLILTTIGVFMTSLGGSTLNIAIPAKDVGITADLGASWEIAQWIPIGFLLVLAISLISFGRLADIKGKRNIFLIGLFIFTVGNGLCASAFSGELLIILYAITGIGASMLTATAIAMVTEVFPKSETGKALGINVAGIYLGLVLGPVLGGLLVQALTWRSVFLVNVPIGGVLFIFGLLKLKQSEIIAKEEKFDIYGMLAFGIFLASMLIALTLGSRIGWASLIIIFLVIISICGFVAFIFIERTVEHPMLNLSLFRRNRVFAAANTAALMNYIATMGVGFLLSIYLQRIFDFDPAIAGLLLLPTPMMMAISSPFTGKYSDRVGTRWLCAIGMMLMAFALGFLIIVILYLPIEWVLLSQGILGLGIGFFSSPNQSAIMKSVEKKQLGIASGTLSTMRVTGQSTSIALLSAILAIFISALTLSQILSPTPPPITEDLKNDFKNGLIIAFSVTIGICIIGTLLSLVRGKEEIH
ncbi:MAG: MFS transporter [Candidatus Helarchaeota archaeon]|nr:MFS transporter [Candidatus Helarchaeota archaeon]